MTSKSKSVKGSEGAGEMQLPRLLRAPVRLVKGLLFDHAYFQWFFILVLLGEAVLSTAIIKKIAYTEIDWIAYMQEVEGFLSGDYNYANLKGQTGPLVYPAGFVYLYSVLYYVTSNGANILLAQYIFMGIYLAFIAVLLLIYHHTKLCPPWVFLLLCVSRRIHSIFMLRCFNDCCAMLLVYIALYFLLKNRWTWGVTFVSLALSIKMNILLFMPALGILLLQRFGVWRTAAHLVWFVVIQVILGAPFLLTFPAEYFGRAFEFSRAFFYIWTVNLKILDEETFLSPQLAKGLLMLHVAFIVFFLQKMLDGGLLKFIRDMLGQLFSLSAKVPPPSQWPSKSYITTLMFVMNFVGIICARSLHYQFYVWYYHTLPLLLFLTPIPTVAQFIVLFGIEVAWNVFPATATSSGILIACHLVLVLGLMFSGKLPKAPSTSPEEKKTKKVQ